MSFLSWITDEKLVKVFKNLKKSVDRKQKKIESKFYDNVIDPFYSVFSMELFDLSTENWKKSEISRQIGKTLSNAVGTFHQQILGSVNGWKDLHNKNMVDIVNDERKIIAEIKNKYNTMNANSSINLYNKLSYLVNNKSSMYKGYMSYCVMIIPKTPRGIDHLFTPSDNALGERVKPDERIRAIDGRRFYALATGVETALDDLFAVAPKVLEEIGVNKKESLEWSYVDYLFKRAYIEE